MIKVDIVSTIDAKDFTHALEFLLNRGIKILDIQYKPMWVPQEYLDGVSVKGILVDRALVVYDDCEGAEE